MSENLKNSKTEFVIAIDEEDSDDNNEDIDDNTKRSIDKCVALVLDSVIESIETLPKISTIDVQTVDNELEEEICEELPQLSAETDHCLSAESDPKVVKIGDRVVRHVDDLEDVHNLEVNIYYNESEDSDIDLLFDDKEEDEDIEGEDCMVIDDIDGQTNSNPNEESEGMDDDIEFIQECNPNTSNDEKPSEVIDLSDDEDCVIINDSFTEKLNKLTQFGGSSQPKRSLSPIFSSESFIPLSEPSTSSGFRRSSGPVRRGFATTGAKSHSSSSHKNSFQSTYYDRSHANSSSHSNSSSFWKPMDNTLTDESIPFLYEETKPSTSSDSIGSSNVGDIDLISECVKLNRNVVQNVLNLIEDQCTVPFITRYRQSAISGIDAEKVRRINNIYNELKNTREKAKEVENTLKKQDRLNPRLSLALKRCKNVFEVEHLYQLCRNESESSEKYRNLGLTDSAIAVLEGKRLDPKHFVNRFAIDLDTIESIEEGWSAIIADIISKDCDVLEFLIAASKQHIPTLHVMLKEDKVSELRKDRNPKNQELIQKYLRFKSFKKPIDRINAHSYMAIERGENIGLLNVFIEFETIILNKLIDFCLHRWERCISHFLVNCVRIAFNNQLKPSLQNYIRWELRHSAHMTALDVFRNNVKHLLLEPPLRGEYVIGVDPGFDSGCKVALVSPWGIPLECKVLKLDTDYKCEESAQQLKKLMDSVNCSIIALGNGSGCRRFENLLNHKIRSNFFERNVNYKIISESGVSWYSVTEEAKHDLPHFSPNLIGAISIARRLIDPLSELVKVDPKRLQVGMYMVWLSAQRDIDEEQVKKAFHEVAVECVSFCGVDVNVASVELLSKISGLEPMVARMIKDKKEKDGLITSRSQLRNIDGISWKHFEQSAGFIKIMPNTRTAPQLQRLFKENNNEMSCKRMATSTDDYDPLDSTIIHPESYSSANVYIQLIGASKQDIGKQSIRNKIKTCSLRYSLPEIAQLCNTDPTNMKLIIEGLSNSIDFDYRTNFAQIYVPDIQHFNDLTQGMDLKGRVVNVTPMGAFIDCGIVGGINAYLNSNECIRHSIEVNDNLMVRIVSIEKILQRFKVSVIQVFKSSIKFA